MDREPTATFLNRVWTWIKLLFHTLEWCDRGTCVYACPGGCSCLMSCSMCLCLSRGCSCLMSCMCICKSHPLLWFQTTGTKTSLKILITVCLSLMAILNRSKDLKEWIKTLIRQKEDRELRRWVTFLIQKWYLEVPFLHMLFFILPYIQSDSNLLQQTQTFLSACSSELTGRRQTS